MTKHKNPQTRKPSPSGHSRSQPRHQPKSTGLLCPCTAPIYRSTLSKCALQVRYNPFDQSSTYHTLCPSCAPHADHSVMLRVLFAKDLIRAMANQEAFLGRSSVDLLRWYRWLESVCHKLKLTSSISFGVDKQYREWDEEERRQSYSTKKLSLDKNIDSDSTWD